LRGNKQKGLSTEEKARAEIAEYELRLEAARIRQCLGITEILLEDYKLWDEGNLLSKIARFHSLVRADAPNADHLRHQDFWQADLALACWRLYGELFEGFDIRAEGWLTPEVSEQIVDRLMQRPAVFAAVGIAGPKFYSTGRDASPKRPKSATKVVGEILARAGLRLRGEQKRVSQMGPVLVNPKGAKCDRSRMRVYSAVGFAELADMVRLRDVSARYSGTFEISIVQLRRSVSKLLSDLRFILEQMVERDDFHREAYW
jgi:hypothetical protein